MSSILLAIGSAFLGAAVHTTVSTIVTNAAKSVVYNGLEKILLKVGNFAVTMAISEVIADQVGKTVNKMKEDLEKQNQK